MELEHSPDGGWGWMVVLGAALINMVNQAIFSIFGLVFGEELKAMADGKAVGITLVMSVNVMVTNLSGLIVGPLMRTLNIRTITVFGIFCTGTGLIISSFATQIYQIIIGYGIFTGFGLGLLASATFLAINDYFTRRKSTAVGLAMAGTSLGQMIMPIFVGILLKNYQYKGTTFILGIISYSGLIGALFFKPMFWCKQNRTTGTLVQNSSQEKDTVVIENETNALDVNDNDEETDFENTTSKKSIFEGSKEPLISHDLNESKENLSPGKLFESDESKLNIIRNVETIEELADNLNDQFMKEMIEDQPDAEQHEETNKHNSTFYDTSLNPFSEGEDVEINKHRSLFYDNGLNPFESNEKYGNDKTKNNSKYRSIIYDKRLNPFEEDKCEQDKLLNKKTKDNICYKLENVDDEDGECEFKKEKTDSLDGIIPAPKQKNCFQKIMESLDLSLLADFTFVHYLIGLALGYTSSVTFSAFFPMFLQDEVGFDMLQTTTCMTALSFADVAGRTTISEIFRRFNMGSRSSFMVGALLLGICRSCLVELKSFNYIFAASLFVGYFRAATVINQNLVISEYISKEKLPSAIGLNMVTKGLVVITLGQSLGLLKDAFSYGACIHLLNIILYLVVISWSLELAIKKNYHRLLINFISNNIKR